MVYPRTASTRAYAIALCSLAMPLSTSQRDTTTVVCEVSDGDKNFGVRVVNDVGCLNGGLGCYNDHCRYCKLFDTPKSTRFESCALFGATFPTMAPLTATTGSCEISEGDAAAGIAAVVDADCSYGGLGCFNDHCRFCKVKETPESTAFLGCNDFNASTIVTDVQSATFTDCSTIAGATVVAKLATDPPTDVPTETPIELPTGVPSVDGTCQQVAALGDIKVGIVIVTDTTCATGGIGCITDVCRYCRLVYTRQSAAFTDCGMIRGTDAPTNTPTAIIVGTEAPSEAPTRAPVDQPGCPQVVSAGDASVGINIVTDTTCSSGGLGCIDTVCRFCKTLDTPQSTTYTDCTSITGYSAGAVTTTDAPTEAPTDAPSDAPTETPTIAVSTSEACTQAASEGDASVGIGLFTDTSCASGGVGCIDDVCRFCKLKSTEQSAAFVDCPST
ncbi:uncharacterized protein PITG_15964 [Phytophthora infestans T30-4]|uniref:Uncharacterized protein n=1 Tax=Phytophthora infestans (strain T30-4) TaxID=403677 RepID=D0NS51_PHYIT|nr:uncharacterized protein PITG_15964 [Phytophthora infestans T30-4]EEY63592.1 conserved hypothetical protein [Phytophthora infestans T30-4]|eukprot:XP_002898179.1 conserved hypothetical protein [Phytophthora infestans T30-4]